MIRLSGAVLICCFIAWHPRASQQVNTPPKVTITKPSGNDRFAWNTLISYSISVDDKEDGTSAYDEIAGNDVFLKIRFLTDSSKLKTYLSSEAAPEARALTYMKTLDCFNCHAAKSKLIGPSFETMAMQYATNPGAINLLSQKIIKGSASGTGTEKMPAHPDLTPAKTAEIVRWILKNGAEPNVDFLRGLEGGFRTKLQPKTGAGRGVYLLIASYTDHGLPEQPQTVKQGRHTIVLRSQ